MIKRLLLLIAPIVFLSYTTIIVAQTSSVKTKVGNPKGGDGGWPTSGIITQGPDGAYDHGPLHLNALDIASGSSPPIYSVFDGTVTAVHDMTSGTSVGVGSEFLPEVAFFSARRVKINTIMPKREITTIIIKIFFVEIVVFTLLDCSWITNNSSYAIVRIAI